MNVYICSIAKNEAKHIERWANSAKDADGIYLLDTGSTDETLEIAGKLGLNVFIKVFDVWRFDIARNHLLDLLPQEDAWLIWLDLDEVLLPGWRKAFENLPADVNRLRYHYTWNFNPDGSEGLVYSGDKIVKRNSHRWKGAVHEVNVSLVPEVQHYTTDLRIEHHADNSKPRSQYLPLLKMAAEEEPDNDRQCYYYARELYFYGQVEESIKEFKRHLSLPSAQWDAERAWSMRYLSRMIPEEREKWLLRACAEYPHGREPWVDLAQHYFDKNNFLGCAYAAGRALQIVKKEGLYLNEALAWGEKPHDLYAIGCYWIGKHEDALTHGYVALKKKPGDERLQKNVEFYEEKVDKSMHAAFKAIAQTI